jgi:hypothetical protein
MTLPNWTPPIRIVPSPSYLGEPTKDTLHLAVGRALNEWELVESQLALIFAHLVESKSAGARRAYGMLIAGRARREALEAVAKEFFRARSDPVKNTFSDLFKAYAVASTYRNNVAHGICYAIISSGGGFHSNWFLYPPHYNTRRRSDAAPAGASYIYKASDIDNCTERFTQLVGEANALEAYLRVKYPLQ